MIVEDSVNLNAVLIVGLVLATLVVYFRGHFSWYRELRGGLWIQMHKTGSSFKRWRKKYFRYFGIWKGWSNWLETGQTHPTRSYLAEKRRHRQLSSNIA